MDLYLSKTTHDLELVGGDLALVINADLIAQLIKQRRRWTNGSLFAAIYCLFIFCRVNFSAHSKGRIFFIYILFLFYMAQMFLTLALVGSFYAVFSIFIRSMFPTDKCKSIYEVANVLENFYLLLLFVILIVSVTRKVEKSGGYY